MDRLLADAAELPVDALYLQHRVRLVHLALLLVDDLPTAEDVVQDVFTSLAAKPRVLRSDPGPYLRTAVVNRSRDVLRRRRTARSYVPPADVPGDGPEATALLAAEHREMLRALSALPQRQREVLVLRYWHHLSEAEIATTLGIPGGTVKSTASRALSALERALGSAA